MVLIFSCFPTFLVYFFLFFDSSSFFVLGPRLKLFLIHNTSKVFLLVFSLYYWIVSFYLYFSYHFLQCSYHFVKSLLRLWVVFVISIHLIILFFCGGITQTTEVHLFKIFSFISLSYSFVFLFSVLNYFVNFMVVH